MKDLMITLEKILNFGKGKFVVSNVLTALAVILVAVIIAKISSRVIRRAVRKSKLRDSEVGFIVTVVRILLVFIGVIIGCDFVGIPVTSLVAVLSVAGLAISLSVQDLLSNLISGFVILVTNPFEDGDFIEIAGKTGRVQSTGFMYTRLLTGDNKSIYIPNHEVCISNIINYTDEALRRCDLIVSASYDNSADEVRKSITKAFSKVEGIITEPEPFVGVKEYGASAISYDVRVWCQSVDYWKVYYDLNEQIKNCFDADGIEMTYNHIIVHTAEK